MASIPQRSTALISLYKELKKLHLGPVKKMRFQFDPFHQDAHTLRDFLYHVSAQRIRKTSGVCTIKTDIVNDRSEPVLNVLLNNETEVVFKTANLSTLEITQEFNKIVKRFHVPEEIPSPFIAKKIGAQRRK